MKDGANHSYNNKDYPNLESYTDDAVFRVKYGSLQKILILVPIDNIKYVKYKYTEK